MSRTIFLAGSMDRTPPAAWPARLLIASRSPRRFSLSSPHSFRSFWRGTMPWSQSSLMRIGSFSQLFTQLFGMRRIGLPEMTSVRSVSPLEAPRTFSLWALGAADSSAQMKRVPTQTPDAPSASAEARPRPSKIPPAATTTTGASKKLSFPRAASATWGMSGNVPMSPVCPPPSLPWAMRMSAPASRAFSAFRTEPTMLATTTPAACILSTAHLGGTPIAQMKSFTFSAQITSMSSGR
mmetsp:Transcript_40304/g.106588  ORF Transcript_40304/g.106588 Transcript_40304/m.106588 type:complete len:238 (-) Transcript_40304:374-1087(-)